MKKIFFISIFLSIILNACSSDNLDNTKNLQIGNNQIELNNKNKVKIKQIYGEELQSINDNFKDSDNIIIIDVRSVQEYNTSHLKHAINIPVESMEDNLSSIEEHKNKSIILYCRTGKRSMIAANILLKNGFTDITNAEGVSDYNYNLYKENK